MNGLCLYEKDDLTKLLTYKEIPATNPFRISVDGILGGCLVKRIYLHNDNPKLYYTSITIQIIDESPSGIAYTSGDWSWRLISSVHEPVPEEWEQVANNNILSVGTLGSSTAADVTSYIPIWVRCNVPDGLLAQNIISLGLRISATKYLVS